VDTDGVERRLAAILSADVVGYSRLMAEDETATIRTLTDYREEIAMLVRQHRGRVVDSPGDNVLAEFPTALEAGRAAVEIQRVIQARNADLPGERRMEFRIGVHLGDVAAEGNRIYGDGVNIAARLEGLAEPGGICISGTVYEQVESKLDLGCEDLGEQSVKNIPKPVRAYRVRIDAGRAATEVQPRSARRTALVAALLVVLGVGTWWLWSLYAGRGPTPAGGIEALPGDEAFIVPGFGSAPAIAVLPFENLSGDPEQEYFADGIAEDLITRLSAAGWGFPVIARNSSFVYKGQAVDVKQVSRELGVRYVVEGSVRNVSESVLSSSTLQRAHTSGPRPMTASFATSLLCKTRSPRPSSAPSIPPSGRLSWHASRAKSRGTWTRTISPREVGGIGSSSPKRRTRRPGCCSSGRSSWIRNPRRPSWALHTRITVTWRFSGPTRLLNPSPR
jgi:class 3 adenylate cyclase